MNIYTKGRFTSINQWLNDQSRCSEVRSETLPKIRTLAAVDWLLMRYAIVTTYHFYNIWQDWKCYLCIYRISVEPSVDEIMNYFDFYPST